MKWKMGSRKGPQQINAWNLIRQRFSPRSRRCLKHWLEYLLSYFYSVYTRLIRVQQIVGLEVKLAVAEGAAATMMQERNATEQEKTVLGAQLESVIQRCDELDRAKIQLEEDLRDHQQQVTGLRATLLVTMQGREDFQSTNHALQTRLTCIDEARISAASDNVRLIGDLAQRTDEATALNDEILALAMHLAKSNEERDRERAQGVQLAAQLTATVHQLQNTQAFLGVTDAQLRGIQGDLCTVWNQLQESNKDLDVTRRQLNETCSELSKTQICLNEADLNLRSTNAELQNSGRLFNMTNAQLQTTRADLESARQALRVVETQHETTKAVLSTKDRELENAKTVSNSIRAEMQDATDRAAARERALQNKVQEVEDERDQAKEAQAHIRAVWAAGEEQRRAAAEAEERLRHALFPGPATRRDPSFRDSGVSFTL
ncbi:hypothetical protein K439DRAFT_261220 [Ramaria rubella]|nr:hypothetical protein K439DRAFT_261220 [Ramaria rubella]